MPTLEITASRDELVVGIQFCGLYRFICTADLIRVAALRGKR